MTSTSFKNAIISGANNLFKNRIHVDELNIFPVPDGDTGSNMSMTINSAVEKIKNEEYFSAFDVAKDVASALLRGARGNSGVILSLLFRGFPQIFENSEEITGSHLVDALEIGVKSAYAEVMKPTEGTILTVARIAAEYGRKAVKKSYDVIKVWEEVCKGADYALASTPDLLPVLKKAGVVDAGGKGLTLVFEGMLSVFKDNIIIDADALKIDLSNDDEFRNAAAEFDQDITFTYCTEFIVKKAHGCKLSIDRFKKNLYKLGDCVVVASDDEIIKVHVHTEAPGLAMQEGLRFGQLIDVKINNMREQHRIAAEAQKAKLMKTSAVVVEPKEPTEKFGFVAIASGEGICNVFKDLGCEQIVTGGQTMNPSTDRILQAILATPAKTIYVFPNNKNIIMAAKKAAELTKDRDVIIIPTKTIPQGLSAILAFDSDLNANENEKNMINQSAKVKTGSVTFAARDSEFGGFKIKEGDILALFEGKLIEVEKDEIKAITKLAKKIIKPENEFINLIYGENISLVTAEEAKKSIKSAIKRDLDITLIDGKQPIYHFILSVE